MFVVVVVLLWSEETRGLEILASRTVEAPQSSSTFPKRLTATKRLDCNFKVDLESFLVSRDGQKLGKTPSHDRRVVCVWP